MPTSSQSRILSVVDQQLLQQSTANDETLINQTSGNETKRRQSRDDLRQSTGRRNDEEKTSPAPPNLAIGRQNSARINDSKR